jgi:hypothetical protein
MKHILDQLARNSILLPDHLAKPILAGNTPPIEEIVMAMLIGSLDCEATVRNDPASTWNERRIARQCLAAAFLSAMAVMGKGEAEKQCGVPTVTLQDGKL